ncbi:permease [Demequina iriomotensis]|uniref:permease n=1 Tax=Demequina iriomotensis TaxID=1536641 RepID=UPI00078348CC|nr:permease [Demequina iriomotensis]
MSATATRASSPHPSARLRGGLLGALGAAAAIIVAGDAAVGTMLGGLGVDLAARWGSALHFWVYESAKILTLVALITFAVGVLGTWLTPDRVQALLSGRRAGVGNLAAAGLGVLTPFCSCSAVPLYMGLVRAGVPTGVTLSFLVASPLVDGVALALLAGIAGWGAAAIYLAFGVTLAVGVGLVLGGRSRGAAPAPRMLGLAMAPPARPTLDDRLRAGLRESRKQLRRLWPWVLAALAVGAAVHGWVPTEVLVGVGGAWWGVPVAALVGIPLYSGTATAVPLIAPLHAAGVPLGTLIAFLMSVVALSVPEMVMLRKVMTTRLLASYVATVAAGIVAIGYLLNAVT